MANLYAKSHILAVVGYIGIYVMPVSNLYAKVPHFGGARFLYIGHTSGKSLREGPINLSIC